MRPSSGARLRNGDRMTKTALITGVSGQDGAYLSKFLLEKGYQVFGGSRRSSRGGMSRLEELKISTDIQFVNFDLADLGDMIRAIDRAKPDEIYNLAAQTFV